MLNRCVQSRLCFKVFNFYHGFCKAFSQQPWEKETTRNHWVLKAFLLRTEKVCKVLSISVDAECTCVFLKSFPFLILRLDGRRSLLL